MYQLLQRYLLLLFAVFTIFPNCVDKKKGYDISDPFLIIIKRITVQTTHNAIITESQHVFDSISTVSPKRLRPMVQMICHTLVNTGRQKEAISVAALAYGIDEMNNPVIASRLLTSTLLPGKVAPQIAGLLPANKKPKYTLLLFHESKCRTCGNIIWEMKQHYGELQNAGVRVVTISTDTDAQTWTEYATGLPWPDKLCDYQGFYSPTMIAYGVVATPALYLFDGKGIVVDQFATFGEISEAISNGLYRSENIHW